MQSPPRVGGASSSTNYPAQECLEFRFESTLTQAPDRAVVLASNEAALERLVTRPLPERELPLTLVIDQRLHPDDTAGA
jgi:hypothetical protein